MLDEAAHGGDAGAGGDEDAVGERGAQEEHAVRPVELDGLAGLEIAEEIGEEALFDTVDAKIEFIRAWGRSDGVGAGLLLAAAVGGDGGDELAGGEGEVVGAFDGEGQVEALGPLGEQALAEEAGGVEGAFQGGFYLILCCLSVAFGSPTLGRSRL